MANPVVAVADSVFPNLDLAQAALSSVNAELKMAEDASVEKILDVAADADGLLVTYGQINADVIANQAAKHLAADALVLVTSAPGVVRDLSDLSTRIPTMTVSQARAAIADGTVQGGMIPKLDESIRVLENGEVSAIHIVGDLEAGDLLRELAEPGSVGTALLP